MSVARSVPIDKTQEQVFVDALTQADTLAKEGAVRIPYVFAAYKTALELYQQVPGDNQSAALLALYSDCRVKFLRYSSVVISDLIKPTDVTNDVKDKLIKHADTVLDLREKYLTASDESESINQFQFRQTILHLKKDFEIIKVAASWGFNCINIPKDGNCLFNAVADQLKLHDLVIVDPLHDVTHHALRLLAAKHLHENRDCYAAHVSDDTTLSNHTTALARSGTWGDHLEIMALVRELSITMMLIQEDQNIMVFKSHHAKAVFYLGYETNYHFVSLHKKDNSHWRAELQTKINEAPAVEIGPYILHASVEKKKPIPVVPKSEPTSSEKKKVLPLLGLFFKTTSTVDPAEEKNKPQKGNKLLALFTRSGSSSSGPR